MSPGGRRGRGVGTSDESHLRDLSPHTTLQAFTQRPMPYDTTRDEYKIFACIEALTPAERDLGARVARAAQRLKSWCEEIEQWGWSGSFEPPSEEYRERRRQSLELRIREHVKDADVAEKLPPLEYWGSLLSVEVQAHEARLDDMSEELIALDIEELKGHVLDMHPGSKSRPSSAGYGADRRSYKPLDDFNFLITQTLLSALPHHFQLKERLSAWTARVTILREAPRFLDDLHTTQKAMALGWQALAPPEDLSNDAFATWKKNVDTISQVLRDRVSDLGRRLDRMLDTLEGRDDCLPNNWIDTFEGVEADLGRWTHESRKKAIEFELRKVGGNKGSQAREGYLDAHSEVTPTVRSLEETKPDRQPSPEPTVKPRVITAFQPEILEERDAPHQPASSVPTAQQSAPDKNHEPASRVPTVQESSRVTRQTEITDPTVQPDSPSDDSVDDSVFEEGDTVVHHEVDDETFDDFDTQPTSATASEFPAVNVGDDLASTDRPQTPRLRGASIDSFTSSMSFSSSPPGAIDDSPSMRSLANQNSKPPRPALNAAMTKRRPAINVEEIGTESNPPWPPSQFSAKASAEDLERKISDILTTIPGHIRLTSETGADARNRKAARGVKQKGSKGFLRAEPSLGRMKSPELTLSPVKQDYESANGISGRRSAAANSDNDIKLYHLTQPGKDQPLKLSIRRVGKYGERVMVRVGGGWADLGEYLRQYAEHHGRRTASNGEFELMGLEVKHSDYSPTRPESGMSRRDRRISAGEPGSANTTPVRSTGASFSTDDAPPPQPNFAGTPTGADIPSPSTGSSKSSWQGNEVGLAGPTSRKLDLSEQKLEWVEGMMKQARSVSGTLVPQTSSSTLRADSRGESHADGRSESRGAGRKSLGASQGRAAAGPKPRRSQPDLKKAGVEFGALGKVGGTKRIFMRGGAGGGAGTGEH